jgi:hypothetical protein
MCVISDKITFCTCNSGSVEALKNYWALYRADKGKNEFLIGEPMLPSEFTDPNYKMNSLTLSKRLNEPDAFDIPIEFKSKDQLLVVLNNSADGADTLTYCFIFSKGKWRKQSIDVFQLINEYKEFTFGKMQQIKNANKTTQ